MKDENSQRIDKITQIVKAVRVVYEINMMTVLLVLLILMINIKYWCSHILLANFVPSQLSGWRASPSRKPLASIYVKLFGQEIAFANIDKAVFDQIIEVNNLMYIRIFIFQFSTNLMSDIFGGIFASSLDHKCLRTAERLSSPCCMVSINAWLNRCWSVRFVTSFPLLSDFPWNLASTLLEWLLQQWNVSTTVVWDSLIKYWGSTQY